MQVKGNHNHKHDSLFPKEFTITAMCKIFTHKYMNNRFALKKAKYNLVCCQQLRTISIKITLSQG